MDADGFGIRRAEFVVWRDGRATVAMFAGAFARRHEMREGPFATGTKIGSF